ncbi:AraC family transcriptional regulator [Gordonia sp. VNK1]|jgi:AraC-like DNA-binding protein|uniref:AraC family transcriptional regulator n=1 Tax=Gordonia oleivorans TaxID=3156618 RepID=UPI0032B60806
MDALGLLLNGPRAVDPMILRMVMTGDWAVRITDRAPLTVVAVTRGDTVLSYDDGSSSPLNVGDVALIRGTEPYTIGATANCPPIAIIDESGHCLDPTGRHSVAEQMSFGVRSWGNTDSVRDTDTVMLVGTYQTGTVGRHLLDSLNRITVVESHDDPLVAMTESEAVVDAPGQEAVLSRLLDLLLITALRRALAAGHGPAWVRAHSDRVVGQSLRLLHNNIDHPWTVASLAEQVGVSRAVIARRFTELVGAPPMTYLATWRLSVAADMLDDTDATLDVIARRVGYGSAFALSTAFKRRYGVSPAVHRRRATGHVPHTTEQSGPQSG